MRRRLAGATGATGVAFVVAVTATAAEIERRVERTASNVFARHLELALAAREDDEADDDRLGAPRRGVIVVAAPRSAEASYVRSAVLGERGARAALVVRSGGADGPSLAGGLRRALSDGGRECSPFEALCLRLAAAVRSASSDAPPLANGPTATARGAFSDFERALALAAEAANDERARDASRQESDDGAGVLANGATAPSEVTSVVAELPIVLWLEVRCHDARLFRRFTWVLSVGIRHRCPNTADLHRHRTCAQRISTAPP
jgi:hypothetical protein